MDAHQGNFTSSCVEFTHNSIMKSPVVIFACRRVYLRYDARACCNRDRTRMLLEYTKSVFLLENRSRGGGIVARQSKEGRHE